MFDILEIHPDRVGVGLCRYKNMKGNTVYRMWLTAHIRKTEDGRVIVTTPDDLFIQKSLHYAIMQAVTDAWRKKYETL